MPIFPDAKHQACADEWLFDMELPSGKTYSVYILDGDHFAVGGNFESIEADSLGKLVQNIAPGSRWMFDLTLPSGIRYHIMKSKDKYGKKFIAEGANIGPDFIEREMEILMRRVTA